MLVYLASTNLHKLEELRAVVPVDQIVRYLKGANGESQGAPA